MSTEQKSMDDFFATNQYDAIPPLDEVTEPDAVMEDDEDGSEETLDDVVLRLFPKSKD